MNIDMDAMVSTTAISKSFGKYLAESKNNPYWNARTESGFSIK